MTTALDKLGRRIAKVEALAQKLARQPRLGTSSIEGGGIDQYTTNGSYAGRFGEQFDGTNGATVFTGPPPPRPNPPTVDPVINGLKVRYDGTFADGPTVVAPLDFSHYEVHVSTDAGMSGLLFSTLKGTINTARGAEILVHTGASDVPFYACIVARSLSGRASNPSPVVGPFLPDKVATADLGFDIDDLAGNTVYRQTSAPVGTLRYGDLWLDIPEQIPYRWSPGDPDAWVEVQGAGVADAIDELFAAEAGTTIALKSSDALVLSGLARNTAEVAQQAASAASAAAAAAQAAATLAQGTAASKVTVYRQTSAPVGGTYGVNDLWLDTDDNNKLYAWTDSAWELSADQRIATALTNASTAQTTAAAKTTLFAQTSQPSTTGRALGDTWLDTDDSNKVYVWTGSAWTATLFGVAALAVTARQLGAITIYRQASQPASGMVTGDYWIDSDDNKPYYYDGSTWVVSQDTAINTAITNAATAQATADGKVRVFSQTSAPTGLVAGDVDDVWIDTDDGNKIYTWSGTAWVSRALGTGALQPNAIVASSVLATGTITAALFESILVLATTIIAGNPNGNHARMSSTGFRVFADDPLDGLPNEVVRMGTETNDFFAIINSLGQMVASIDDTGGASFSRVVADSMFLAGSDLAGLLDETPLGEVGRYQNTAPGERGPIYLRYGIAEVAGLLVKGRAYRVDWKLSFRVDVNNDEARFLLHWSAGADGDTVNQAPAPTINSPTFANFFSTGPIAGRWYSMSGSAQIYPARTAQHRILLSMERGVGGNPGGSVYITNSPLELMITDLGPAGPVSGGLTAGGGTLAGGGGGTSPTSTPQQYFRDLAAAGWESVRGNGTIRPSGDGVVQGWDPSGFNGNGKGRWWFNLPSITGTIDRMDLYIYSHHWYWNSGGTAILNIAPYLNAYAKPKPDWHVGGYPKPGGKEVRLPSDWYPYFRNGGSGGFNRADGVTVGPGVGTDLLYYGRMDGAGARLRIYYTQ